MPKIALYSISQIHRFAMTNFLQFLVCSRDLNHGYFCYSGIMFLAMTDLQNGSFMFYLILIIYRGERIPPYYEITTVVLQPRNNKFFALLEILIKV